MSFLDEFLLHYLDNFFYIIYKEEESPCRNETTKNVYPAGEVFNALNNKLCIFTLQQIIPLSGSSFQILETFCVSVNASYCRTICAGQRARLPTISDFNATENVIRNFAFPGGSIQKISSDGQYVKVRKGFSFNISHLV